jgi:hypothetical protein
MCWVDLDVELMCTFFANDEEDGPRDASMHRGPIVWRNVK